MDSVRLGEVIEALPFVEFGIQIDIVGIAEQLVELLLVRSMRALDLSVQLGRAGFKVVMAGSFVCKIPVELRLELMVVVRPDLANAGWESDVHLNVMSQNLLGNQNGYMHCRYVAEATTWRRWFGRRT